METPDITFYGSILGGNIPFNVLECFKGFNEAYKNYTLINHPYLKIRNENVVELLTINCTENEISNADTVCKEHIKLSLNLNRNMIVNSLQLIIKNAITVSKQRNDKEVNNDTITNIYNEFANKIMNDFKSIPMNRDANDLLIRMCILISLININSAMLNNIMFKLQSDMDLNKPFMVNKYIGTPNKYLNIIKDHLDNNTNIEVVSANIANDMLLSIEYMLNHMISTTNKGNICKIYIASISIANAITKLGSSYNLNRRVEPFDIASKSSIENITRIKNLKDKEETINQNKIIEGINKLITTSITQVLSANKAEVSSLAGLSNVIEFREIISDGAVEFGNTKQINLVNVEQLSQVKQDIRNKINNEIMNKINENIDIVSKDQSSKTTDTLRENAEGSNITDVIKSVADVVKGSIASSSKTKTENDITNDLKEKFTLNQDFTYKKNNQNETSLNEVITNEQANKCASKQDVKNELKVAKIEGSSVKVSGIAQENIFKSVNTCITDQFTNNEIAKKVYNEFENIMTQLIDNARTSDDKLVLEGAGKTLEGAGKAIESAGKGAAYALMGPIIGGVVALIVIGLLIYVLRGVLFGSSSPAPVEAEADVETPDMNETATEFKYLFNLNM